jgi:hypothetical protein
VRIEKGKVFPVVMTMILVAFIIAMDVRLAFGAGPFRVLRLCDTPNDQDVIIDLDKRLITVRYCEGELHADSFE